MDYLFHLGRERELAIAELAATLPASCLPQEVIDEFLFVESLELFHPIQLQERLGGTISIARVVDRLRSNAPRDEIILGLIRLAEASPTRNIGLSWYGQVPTAKERRLIAFELKAKLKSSGRSIRLVTSPTASIRSVVVHDQLLTPAGTEYILLTHAHELMIAETVSCQNWRAWSQRDYGRPERDPHRGMLPPKLARIMVNLVELKPDDHLLDPFCGVGTVLMEAGLLGHQRLTGSDRDQKAIDASRLNWMWLTKTFGIAAKPTFLTAPVEALKRQLSGSVDAIVTEANLGPFNLANRPAHDRLSQMKLLKKDYGAWLLAMWELVKPGGRVVLAYPLLRQPRYELALETDAKQIGWKVLPALPPSWESITLASPLTYARPDQLIGRQLLLLQKPIQPSARGGSL